MLSIIIPSRNEEFLEKTIQDVLTKAQGEIEVITILDGYWPEKPLTEDSRLKIIHRGSPFGMRAAVNAGVAIAKGDYIMKCDAHCMFDKGFDDVLTKDCDKNWVVVPRRYALDPENWKILDNPKYPIDYMYLSADLHGEVWNEKNKDPNLQKVPIDDLMASQGSCWFMSKAYFEFLDLEDEENYGKFWNEMQEISFKCWLSGGRMIVNKNTWYAHWHKTKGRGYSLSGNEQEKALFFVKRWLNNTAWHKQTLPFTWLIEKFWPVPTWNEDKNKWTE